MKSFVVAPEKPYKNFAVSVFVISIFCTPLYVVFDLETIQIDYFDLVCDLFVVSTLLVIIFYIQQIRSVGVFHNHLAIGLSFLYFSFYVDFMDEIFYPPIIIKNIFENAFHVIGLTFTLVGTKGWLNYNKKVQDKLIRNATIDQLTNTLNRREFLRLANSEFSRSKRYNYKFSAIFIDIDFFKKINDSFGHSAGDTTLLTFANSIKKLFRESDIFCRWGGEEFIVLLLETDLSATLKLAEKMRTSIEALSIPVTTEDNNSVNINVTISLGCSTILDKDASIHDVLNRADKTMYLAKKRGRNRVCHSGELGFENES